MIKKFFARLTGWNSMEKRPWGKSAAERLQEENARLRELAQERQQRQLDNMKEGERLRRLHDDMTATTETKDNEEAA